MRKIAVFLIGLFCILLACEKDDICVEDTTPRLIIKFYSKESSNPAILNELTVWPEGRDSIYNNQALDSIFIPLNVFENNTKYKFSSAGIVDEINFDYVRNDVFVSRSCGYKTIFTDLSISSFTTEWIKDVQIIQDTINNETTPHIFVYH